MKNNRRKSPKVIIGSIIVIICTVLLVVGAIGYSLLGPVELLNAQEKRYIVSETTTLTAIAEELAEMGIVRSAQGLTFWSQLTGRNDIPKGIYLFSTRMPIFEVGDILTDGRDSNERVLTLIEGDTIPQVATKIAEILEISDADVLAKMADKTWIKSLQADYWFLTDAIFTEGIKHPLEGYLAADTYFIQADSSVESVVVRLLDQMSVILAPYEAAIADFDLEIDEVLTLASIVEREASERADRELVAGVFMNRLAAEMPLGSDVTVAYAIGKVALNFTNAELQTDSPYNTYVITGLPVGPVGNPSADAIEAI
ncbi:MAG: endolytic transglycosylase MltG, partial [Culicoidibacterales bacterium]